MEKLKDRFSKPLCRHLNNVFIHLGNEGGDTLGVHHSGRDLCLPIRTDIHKNLVVYAGLMHWLKQMEPKNYQQLQKTYTSSLEKLYQRDLDRFFEDAFVRVSGSLPPVGASQDVTNVRRGGKVIKTKTGVMRDYVFDQYTASEHLPSCFLNSML